MTAPAASSAHRIVQTAQRSRRPPLRRLLLSMLAVRRHQLYACAGWNHKSNGDLKGRAVALARPLQASTNPKHNPLVVAQQTERLHLSCVSRCNGLPECSSTSGPKPENLQLVGRSHAPSSTLLGRQQQTLGSTHRLQAAPANKLRIRHGLTPMTSMDSIG